MCLVGAQEIFFFFAFCIHLIPASFSTKFSAPVILGPGVGWIKLKPLTSLLPSRAWLVLWLMVSSSSSHMLCTREFSSCRLVKCSRAGCLRPGGNGPRVKPALAWQPLAVLSAQGTLPNQLKKRKQTTADVLPFYIEHWKFSGWFIFLNKKMQWMPSIVQYANDNLSSLVEDSQSYGTPWLFVELWDLNWKRTMYFHICNFPSIITSGTSLISGDWLGNAPHINWVLITQCMLYCNFIKYI